MRIKWICPQCSEGDTNSLIDNLIKDTRIEHEREFILSDNKHICKDRYCHVCKRIWTIGTKLNSSFFIARSIDNL